METTYRSLIEPIPAKYNLASVARQPALQACDICKAAVPDRARAKDNTIATRYELIDEYPYFPLLKKSANAGCGLCWIVRKALRQSWAVRPMEEWGVGPLSGQDPDFVDLLDGPWDRRVRLSKLKFELKPLADHSSSDSTLRQGACTSQGARQRGHMVTAMTLEFGPLTPPPPDDGSPPLHGDISQILNFKVFDSTDLESNEENCRRRLPSLGTLSDENIDMIRGWIDGCVSNHAACRVATTRPLATTAQWLPTRLLDVGIDTETEFRHPRVIETADMIGNTNMAYAALSHMWGDPVQGAAPPLQALRSNFREITERGIDFGRLPRTFADAVITCRRLGIRYIWIDSLCIIQDSSQDWGREAGTMHLVYKFAEVTVVATSATSSHDGFLHRNLSTVPAAKIQYELPNVYGEGAIGYFILTPIDDHQRGLRNGDVDGSKWNTRGWTMQERSLATRLVHFCHNKIYFECRGRWACEENSAESLQVAQPIFTPWPRPSLDQSGDEPSSEWYRRWRRAVIAFSRRQLTVPSDKLTAIRSLANEMAAHLGPGDYYIAKAGVWRDNLLDDLLWYVESGIARRPREYRAPSWSWASLDAPIGFAFHAQNTSCPATEMVIMSVTSTETDTRCQILGYRRPIAGIQETEDRMRSRYSFPYNIMHCSPSNGGKTQTFAHGVLDLDNRDGLLLESGGVLCYLHISSNRRPSGLILRRHRSSSREPFVEEGCTSSELWERVGCATIFHTSGDLIDLELFKAEDGMLAAECTLV